MTDAMRRWILEEPGTTARPYLPPHHPKQFISEMLSFGSTSMTAFLLVREEHMTWQNEFLLPKLQTRLDSTDSDSLTRPVHARSAVVQVR